jgi:hypothetical protein
MMARWAALAVTVLVLGTSVTRDASAQGINPQTGERGAGSGLGQNYPNPFGVDTRIQFTIGDYPSCTDQGRQYRVTLRIFNLLSQIVSVPVLESGGSVAGGESLESVMLSCGQYTAYWDGAYLNSSQPAPSGVYLYRLEVDGRPAVKKMFKSR